MRDKHDLKDARRFGWTRMQISMMKRQIKELKEAQQDRPSSWVIIVLALILAGFAIAGSQ